MLNIDPAELLPHRGNMLLVKGFEHVDMQNKLSSVLAQLGEDCLFYDKAQGGVPTELSIELMAQGVGLLSCYLDWLQGKPSVKSAVLLSVKHYETYCDLLPINTLLRTTNKISLDEPPMGVYNCELYTAADNTLLARAEITAYKP